MIRESFLTNGRVAQTLASIEFAVAQMGLDMAPEIGAAYRAGWMSCLRAVAISFGVPEAVEEPPRRQVTVLAPERLRLGGGR